MINRLVRVLFVLTILLCGCASTPTPRYYRVYLDSEVVNDGSFQSYRDSLRVAPFRAAAPLRQDSIVTYQDQSARIEFTPYDVWETSPSQIVRQKLAEAFHASRIFHRVETRPSRPAAEYLIRGRIIRFNQLQTSDGLYGEVGLEVELVRQSTGEILWSTVLRAREEARGSDTEAAVIAVSEALRHCILQIIQQVKQTTASHQLMH